MFQFFRRKDKAVRILLGSMLVLICVMLVVTLIPGLTAPTGTDETVVAEVGGVSISSTEVTRQLQQMTRNSRMPPSLLPLYAPQVINQMVTERAMLLEAERLGLNVTHEELISELRQNPQLFPEGKFIGDQQYTNFIEARFNMTVPEFEERYRESLAQEKLRRVVTSPVTVSDPEVVREFHRRNDKVRVEYAVLKTDDVRRSLTLPEADVAAFFEKNRGRYTVPERRKFRLVFAGAANLGESLAPTEQELKRYYNENSDQFRLPERAHVSHILLKTVGKSEEEIQQVQKSAEEVLQQARGGKDFAQLARQYSEDAVTTPKGGDLGWIVRGQTVPEFEKAAFTQAPGAVSDLIKTMYGFHIVKVHERQQAHLQTLDEVRGQIEPQVRQEKVRRAGDELVGKAEDTLRRQHGNLQAVASTLGVPVTDTALLRRGETLPGVGSSPAAEESLFAANLRPNELTPAIQTNQGVLVAQLVEVSPAHPAELAEARDQVENDLRNERAAELVASRMKELSERARALGDLKKAGAGVPGIAVKTSEPVSSTGNIEGLGSAASLGEAAFTMGSGEVGGPVAVPEGQVVFRVVERQPASEGELATLRENLRNELLEAKRARFFEVFRDNVKERLSREGKLKVNQAAIDRMAASLRTDY